MAKVKIKIEVNPNADDEELGNIQNQVNNTPSLENVSNVSVKIRGDGIYEEIPSNSGGINGLSLGYALVFDGNGYLDNADLEGGVLESTENPVEFVWGVVPESGEYTVRLTFTDAQSLKDITIFGDSEVNQFPTRAIIDGYKEITNDDLTWYINFGNEASTHTIEFTHWNRVNYNACISKIGITLQYIEIDKTSGLKSVDSTSQSSTDTTGIFYGTVENRGSLEILDKTGELVDMLKDGIIDNSNTKIEVVANNESVQTHISTDSAYNANSQVMSLDLGNRLNSLDILKYRGYPYPNHSERLSVLFFDVLSNLRYALFGKDKELTEEEFKQMLSKKCDADMTLYDYLYSIEVQYPIIEPNRTYRDVIDEFCCIAQMQMYITDEDNVEFVSARPKDFEKDFPVIHIRKKNMFSQLDYSVVLKNKYDGVEISQTNVRDNIDIETTLYTWKSEDEEYEQLTDSDSDETTTTSLGVSIYSYVKVTATYYTATVKFKKQSDNNLEKILSVLDGVDLSGNPRIKYNVNYTHKTGGVNVIQIADSSSSVQFVPEYTFTEEGSGSLSNYGIISDAVGSTVSASLNDKTNLKTLKITSDDNYYYADFKILVGLTKIHGSFTQATTTISGVSETYIPNSVELSIYGNKRTISFEQVQESSANIETAKTKVSIPYSGILLQTKTISKPKSISVESLENWEYYNYLERLGSKSHSFTAPISDNDNFFGIKYNRDEGGLTKQWLTSFNNKGIIRDGWFDNHQLPYTSLNYPKDYFNGDFTTLFNQLMPKVSNYITSNSNEEFEKFKELDGKILYIKSDNSYAKIKIKETDLISYNITQAEMPGLFNVFVSEIPNGNDGSFYYFLKGYKINLTFLSLSNFSAANIILQNISSDYKNGVSSGSVTISCNDYFDSEDEKVINWDKGEIPKLNQIVYFDDDLYADGNQRYWKIKGRTFRKVGVPMIDLELEEVIK